MPTANFQPSFAAGVLTSGMHGRLDISKYDVGLRVGLNAFVHASGGVSNRTGTEFVTEVMDSTKAHRLLPFVRDRNEAYVMLMGDNIMQIIESGAVLIDGGVTYQEATPYASTDLIGLDYVQSVDVMYLAHLDHFPQEMKRSAEFSWTFGNLPIDPVLPLPSSVVVTSDTAGTEEYEYRVSAVDTDRREGFASAAVSITTAADLAIDGSKNTITWQAVAGAAEYNIYRARNGVFGYIGFTDALTFDDENISPNLELTPAQAADVFQTAEDYPSKVALAQQRLIFGNTRRQPENIFASRIGDYNNFTRSRILRADDRINIPLNSQVVNRISSLFELGDLVALGSFGEFAVAGPSGTISATSPAQRQFGYSGSIDVKPVLVHDTALFVDNTGMGVRDLRYSNESDRSGFGGNDLSIFAADFFENRYVAGWAYAKSPDSIVWAYLDDGTLLSFTYKREHQVWAWCNHDIGGQVESITSIPEGRVDGVYMIVKREINGVERRFVERLHDRDFTDDTPEDCFFVDCGVTYSGVETTSITGLDHLNGEAVSVLADGNDVEGMVVSGGQIELPFAAAKVHVGLPFTCEIETLPPAVNLEGVGAARGRPMSVSKVYAQVKRTRGVEVAPSSRREWTELVFPTDDFAREIDLFTGMVELTAHAEWNRDGTIVMRQRYPLPMTVLGLSPELTIGR